MSSWDNQLTLIVKVNNKTTQFALVLLVHYVIGELGPGYMLLSTWAKFGVQVYKFEVSQKPTSKTESAVPLNIIHVKIWCPYVASQFCIHILQTIPEVLPGFSADGPAFPLGF